METRSMETHSYFKERVRPIYNLLRIVFIVLPIVAGIDKFTNILVSWDQYFNPGIASILPFSTGTFMRIVGVIEIIAGIIVLIKPDIGGIIVAAWLLLIAITLVASGAFYDIAVRDIVMCLSAFSMSRIARAYQVTTIDVHHAARVSYAEEVHRQ